MRTIRIMILASLIVGLCSVSAAAGFFDLYGTLGPREHDLWGPIHIHGPLHTVNVHIFWSSAGPSSIDLAMQCCATGAIYQRSQNYTENWLRHTFNGLPPGTYCLVIRNTSGSTVEYSGWVTW